jgi:hypothetical protein
VNRPAGLGASICINPSVGGEPAVRVREPAPHHREAQGAGCTAQADQRVAAIDPAGVESRHVFPCFDHHALTDLFERHRPPIRWRYYTPSAKLDLDGPQRHPPYLPTIGPEMYRPKLDERLDGPGTLRCAAGHRRPRSAGGQLGDPEGPGFGSPGSNDGTGPSWVASIVDEIGRSSYCDDTVVLVTWDDWAAGTTT